MTWLFLAIFPRALWALCNLIDQRVARYFGAGNIWPLVMLENMISLPFIVGCFFVLDDPWLSTPSAYLWFLASAFFNVLALSIYYKVLQVEEAHDVIPIQEFTPLFLIIMAFLIFGETMTIIQLIGGILIVASGFLFSWDFNKSHFKLRAFLMMALCAFCYASNQIVIKYNAVHETPWKTMLWFSVGLFCSGAGMYLFMPKSRKALIQTLKKGGISLIGVVIANEIIVRVALVSFTFAFFLAPSSGHVAALSGIQPFFLLLFSFLFAFLLPKYFRKLEFDKEIKIKLLLLVGIFVGVVLLSTG